MSQSNWHSWMETAASTAVGFAVSWFAAMIVFPLFGFHATGHQSFWITAIFTVLSLLRGIVLRRTFNAITVRAVRDEMAQHAPLFRVRIATMETSAGPDHYVELTSPDHVADDIFGKHRITPYKFRERWKAEWECADWLEFFGKYGKSDEIFKKRLDTKL